MPYLFEQNPSPAATAERELQRRIDLSVGRALCDREYARRLLADPTIVVGRQGSTPQQFLALRQIRARDLSDFARQADALFWPSVDAAWDHGERAISAAAM